MKKSISLNLRGAVCFVFVTALIFGAVWYTTETNVTGAVTGGTLDAPTGVTASVDDYNNKVGLHWDTIRGATTYRIFRNTVDDPGTATDIGTTAANYFFDTGATALQDYFYWVRAENTGEMSGLSLSDMGRRANGTTLPGPFAPLDPPLAPPGNPVTAAKAYLGKALFWDEQMSSTRTVSCGTCHRPAAGGSDPRSLVGNPLSLNPGPDGILGNDDDVVGSQGVPSNNADGTYNLHSVFDFDAQVTGRKSPSYLNAGYSPNGIFWDGRALNEFRDPLTNAVVLNIRAGLESQSVGPPVSAAEMAHAGRNWIETAAQIENSKPLALAENIPAALETWIAGRSYPELFTEAFGSAEVTPARIAMAIATHERTLFSDRTPLDRAVGGIQPLQPNEAAGRQVFVVAQCNLCHGAQLLSDSIFHNIGVRPVTDDAGRFAVSGIEEDRGKFRTPSLRNVELRSSFMHNGRFATMEDVVDFYDRGGDFDAPNIDRGTIRPLNLSAQEKADLAAFLKRPLTDPRVAGELPPFDRPTLYTESSRVPVVSGAGRTGTGGLEPLVTAIEPPLVGNPSFTVAVSQIIDNTQAVLVVDSSDPGVGTTIPATGSFARVTVQIPQSGTGNGSGSVSLAIPDDAAIVGQTFYGRWYVTDGAAANGFAVSKLFEFTVFGEASSSSQAGPYDFDGDGKTDIGVFRQPLGQWWYLRSSDQAVGAFTFGVSTDIPAPFDFTGDGKADVAFFRPSTGEWYVLRSEDFTFYAFPFGTTDDVPAPGDFDNDGTADATVYRPSTGQWFILRSSDSGVTAVPFGVPEDRPVVADFDGDGLDDVAVFRPSVREWWILNSSGGVSAYQFGSPGDIPVQGDYTGDGKADVAFFRPSTGEWYVLRSEDTSFFAFPWGANGDVPVPGDYDSDGITDAAVWRESANGTWFINGSTSGFQTAPFGQGGDVPLPGYRP